MDTAISFPSSFPCIFPVIPPCVSMGSIYCAETHNGGHKTPVAGNHACSLTKREYKGGKPTFPHPTVATEVWLRSSGLFHFNIQRELKQDPDTLMHILRHTRHILDELAFLWNEPERVRVSGDVRWRSVALSLSFSDNTQILNRPCCLEFVHPNQSPFSPTKENQNWIFDQRGISYACM